MNETPSLLVFIHHQKASGTTLRTMLRCQFPPTAVLDLFDEQFDPALLAEVASGIDPEHTRLVMGHLTYGLHRLTSLPVTYITMLREPVDRVLSLYHSRLEKQRADRPDAVVRFPDAAAWVSGESAIEGDNAQTRLLSGEHPPFGEVTEAMLDTAKARLREEMAVVGLSERFDESCALLKRQFGWAYFFHVPRNVTPGRPPSEGEPLRVREELARHNRLDLELHRYATELFDARVREAGPDLAAELRTLASLNARFAEHLRNGGGPPPDLDDADSVMVDATARLWRLEDEVHRLLRQDRRQIDVMRDLELQHRRSEQARALLARRLRRLDKQDLRQHDHDAASRERAAADLEALRAELIAHARLVKRGEKRQVNLEEQIGALQAMLVEADQRAKQLTLERKQLTLEHNKEQKKLEKRRNAARLNADAARAEVVAARTEAEGARADAAAARTEAESARADAAAALAIAHDEAERARADAAHAHADAAAAHEATEAARRRAREAERGRLEEIARGTALSAKLAALGQTAAHERARVEKLRHELHVASRDRSKLRDEIHKRDARLDQTNRRLRLFKERLQLARRERAALEARFSFRLGQALGDNPVSRAVRRMLGRQTPG